MMWTWRAWACAIFVCVGGPAVAAEKADAFDKGPLSRTTWKLCQAAPELLSFDKRDGRAFLTMRIDGDRGDVDQCETPQAAAAIESERLGPTSIPPRRQPAVLEASLRRCPQPQMQGDEPAKQRNELRFRDTALAHGLAEPHWYSMTFKVEGDGGDAIPDCGSVRWVLAQWKYDAHPPGGNDSPFLAQRFDNGVLHVTVEDGFCRCMIAKAEGDPDKLMHANALELLLRSPELHPVPPLTCKVSRKGPDDGKPCKPDHLVLLSPNKDQIPSLPDPKTGWITMTYRITADGPAGARIDVYADGQFIVRAQGRLAADLPKPNAIKFKFGHYRDKIPVRARLLVDAVCLSETAKVCDPRVQPVPD